MKEELHVSTRYKGGWIKKQIAAENKTLVQVLYATSCVFLFTVLIFGTMALSPYIDGVSMLDSREKLERFCGKEYVHATLVYEKAFDTQGTFVISSDDSDEIEYHVWWLTGDGYTVIFCTDAEFEDTGSIQVQSQYLDMNARVIKNFSPDTSPVYVVYDAGSSVPLMVMLVVLTSAAVAIGLLARGSFLKKRTTLGRQIAALGDFREISKEINRQAMEPLFEDSNCTVLKGWLLFRTYTYPFQNKRYATKIWPIGNIADIEITQDEGDSTMYACKFILKNDEQPCVTYVGSQEFAKLEALKKEFLG